MAMSAEYARSRFDAKPPVMVYPLYVKKSREGRKPDKHTNKQANVITIYILLLMFFIILLENSLKNNVFLLQKHPNSYSYYDLTVSINLGSIVLNFAGGLVLIPVIMILKYIFP